MKVAVLPSDLAKCVGMPLDEAECGQLKPGISNLANNNNHFLNSELILLGVVEYGVLRAIKYGRRGRHRRNHRIIEWGHVV